MMGSSLAQTARPSPTGDAGLANESSNILVGYSLSGVFCLGLSPWLLSGTSRMAAIKAKGNIQTDVTL